MVDSAAIRKEFEPDEGSHLDCELAKLEEAREEQQRLLGPYDKARRQFLAAQELAEKDADPLVRYDAGESLDRLSFAEQEHFKPYSLACGRVRVVESDLAIFLPALRRRLQRKVELESAIVERDEQVERIGYISFSENRLGQELYQAAEFVNSWLAVT